jgi:hypothetical protein
LKKAQQNLAATHISECPSLGTLPSRPDCQARAEEACMNQLIYLVGLIVVILAVLSFFGLR